MFYDVFSNELQPLLAPDQRLDSRPLAFKGFLLNRPHPQILHPRLRPDADVHFIKLNAGKAAFIIEGDGRAVFHGTADIVDVDVIAKNTRRIHIVSLDRRSGKPDKGGSGQRIAKIFGKPKEISPVSFFTLAFKPYWLRCASSAMTTTLRRDVSLGYWSPFSGENFWIVVKMTPPGIAVEEPLKIFATLRLYRRLPDPDLGTWRTWKELIIKIVAVGKNHKRGILHSGMQDEPPGIKSHEQTLFPILAYAR